MSTHNPYDPVATAIAMQFGMYDLEHHPKATQKTIDEILAILREVPVAKPESLDPVDVRSQLRCCRCGKACNRPNEIFSVHVEHGMRERTIGPLCGPCVQTFES